MSTWLSADIRRVIWIVTLVVVVMASATLLVTVDPNKFWTVALQVVSVLAGAALGNALTADHSRSLIRQQAGSAIRRLVEQATRMGREVELLEERRDSLNEASSTATTRRMSDWLDDAARSLRDEIDCAASAMEDWGAMAPDVLTSEVENFKTRTHRLALGQRGQEET